MEGKGRVGQIQGKRERTKVQMNKRLLQVKGIRRLGQERRREGERREGIKCPLFRRCPSSKCPK